MKLVSLLVRKAAQPCDGCFHSFKHWANVSCFLCPGIVLCASMLEELTKCLKFLIALYIWERGDVEVKKTAEKNVAGYIGTLWL